MDLTKIDIAAIQLQTAIRLFFADHHPVPIYTLAAAAREILTTLGKKQKLDTFMDELARSRGVPTKDELTRATKYVNFFKHADRDPTEVLLNFSDLYNDTLLFSACRELAKVAKGLPVEAQVYEAWFFATKVKRVAAGGLGWQKQVKRCIQLFPGVRSTSRAKQKQIASSVLTEALKNPALRMRMERVVVLPETDTA